MAGRAACRRDLNAMKNRPGFAGWAPPGPPARCVSGPGAVAHQADGVELGLLAGVFLGALAHLVPLVEQLDLLHLLEGLAERRLGVVELDLELVGGALEVL